MNKKEALIILNSCPREYRDNDNFITIWKNHESRSIIWCNSVNEALEEINKLTNKNKYIALEIDDKFMSDLKDWNCDYF